MKPTVKVSIGGIAFNLEEDAYQLLNDYLQALSRHFSNNPEADEIIADIEARMCELLLMRLGSKDVVVSKAEAQETINIMGNPKDFGDDDTSDSSYSQKQYSYSTSTREKDSFNYLKKKLYRDRDHGLIFGVCSGLGHYFKIDPVVIRVIFVGLLIIFNLFTLKAALTIALIYGILALVIPDAKTFEQKVSMTGTDPSIENIEDRTQGVNNKKYKGSSLSEGLRVLFNILMGIIVVLVSLISLACIISLIWLYFDTEVFYVRNYLLLLGWNTIDYKIALILLFVLPLVGIIRFFVKLLCRSKFTVSTLVSFIIGLCFWCGAIFYVGNKGFSFARNTQYSETKKEIINLSTPSDTLYVKLGEAYQYAYLQPRTSNLFYLGDKMKDRSIFIIPKVIIEKDSSIQSYIVEVENRGFGKSGFEAKRKAENMKLNYANVDSVFYINPEKYDKNNTWNRETVTIIVKSPVNKTVIVAEPLNDIYRFDSYTYNGFRDDNFTIGWDSRWIDY